MTINICRSVERDVSETFLNGFTGWLHADGYQGYHRLPSQIQVVGCLAHARRKFDEALTVVPKEQQAASKSAEALSYFAQLVRLEESFAELTAEERYAKRLEQEKTCFRGSIGMGKCLEKRNCP